MVESLQKKFINCGGKYKEIYMYLCGGRILKSTEEDTYCDFAASLLKTKFNEGKEYLDSGVKSP